MRLSSNGFVKENSDSGRYGLSKLVSGVAFSALLVLGTVGYAGAVSLDTAGDGTITNAVDNTIVDKESEDAASPTSVSNSYKLDAGAKVKSLIFTGKGEHNKYVLTFVGDGAGQKAITFGDTTTGTAITLAGSHDHDTLAIVIGDTSTGDRQVTDFKLVGSVIASSKGAIEFQVTQNSTLSIVPTKSGETVIDAFIYKKGKLQITTASNSVLFKKALGGTTASNRLAEIKINTADTKVTFAEGVNATAIVTSAGNPTVNFEAQVSKNMARVISGNITPSGDNQGVYVFKKDKLGDIGWQYGNGTDAVSFGASGHAVKEIKVDTDAKLSFSEKTTIYSEGIRVEKGAILTFDTMDIKKAALGNKGTIVLNGKVTLGTTVANFDLASEAGAMLEIGMLGKIVADTKTQIKATSKVIVKVNGLTSAKAFTFIDKTDLGVEKFEGKDTYLQTVKLTKAGDSMVVTATNIADATVATSLGISSEYVKALKSANALGSTVIEALPASGVALNKIATAKAAKEVGLQVDAFGGLLESTTYVSVAQMGLISDRIASIQAADRGIMTAGDSSYFGNGENGAWAKVYGYSDEQKDRGTDIGYDSKGFTAVTGVDTGTADGVRVGVSLAYTKSEVKGKAGTSQNDITDITGSLYGSFSFDNYYVFGSAGYGRSTVDGMRKITSPLLLSAGTSAEFDAEYKIKHFDASAGFGGMIEMGNGYINPVISALWVKVTPDKYTETTTSTGVLADSALTVASKDYSSLKTSAMINYQFEVDMDSGSLKPSVGIGATYDVLDDTPEAVITFGSKTTGGYTAYSKRKSRLAVVANLGFVFESEQFVIEAGYNVEGRDKFLGHNVDAMVRFKF